jgi:hypothetical protein
MSKNTVRKDEARTSSLNKEDIKFGKKVFIRNAGKDEYWLQDLIYENPSILQLGPIVPVSKEKRQSSGGKLDILLKNPEDNSMYEIEIMLGATDPSHIIRTIEYWDIEKRRYPQRQHFPVLIAESFNKRYFNVIQILSLNVPMIAIQVDLLEVDDKKIINFTKILDIYEEQAEDDETTVVSETTWSTNANWTLQTAKELLSHLNQGGSNLKLNFTQSYVSLVNSNRGNAYWLHKRTDPKSYFGFKEKDDEKVEAIKEIFDKSSLPFTYNKYKEFLVVVDKEFIKKHKDIFMKVDSIRFTNQESFNDE